MLELAVALLMGLFFGSVLTFLLMQKLSKQNEALLDDERTMLFAQVKESFDALSHQALHQNSDQFLKIANQTLQYQSESSIKSLDAKKELIDQSLKAMNAELYKVDSKLNALGKGTEILQQSTTTLNELLGNSRSRGQWGERMADDVLRLAGFEEGINYSRQSTTASGSRPDFSFYLPKNLTVNMDVKFPFDNYMRYQESTGDDAKMYLKQFIRDVKARIKEVTTRDYINPAEGTVDYALIFVPNESVFTFMVSKEPSLIDDALAQKIILCSPLSLYAILAIMRQGIENFHLQKTGARILELFSVFDKQWQAFNDSLAKLGRRLDDAQKEFNNINNTRKNTLEKSINDITSLRESGETGEVHDDF